MFCTVWRTQSYLIAILFYLCLTIVILFFCRSQETKFFLIRDWDETTGFQQPQQVQGVQLSSGWLTEAFLIWHHRQTIFGCFSLSSGWLEWRDTRNKATIFGVFKVASRCYYYDEESISVVEQPNFDFQVHYWLSTFFSVSSTFLGENKYI